MIATLERHYEYYFPSGECVSSLCEAGWLLEVINRRFACIVGPRKPAVGAIERRETVGVASVKLRRED